MKNKRLYHIWYDMHRRCESPKCAEYAVYGARGIRVCAAWRSYAAFAAFAYRSGYADNLTIDRIDNNGNYEPGNVQWLTRAENASKGSYDNALWRWERDTADALDLPALDLPGERYAD